MEIEQCDFCDRPAVYQRFQKAYDQSQPYLADRHLYCEQCGWVGLERIHPEEHEMTEPITKEPHKIVNVEKVHDGKFLNVMLSTYEYTNKVGDRVQGKWEWISRSGQTGLKCDAVVIAAIHLGQDGVQRLVVTEEGRVPISGLGEITREFGFPAGLVDPGQTPQEAVVAEVWQETGLKVTEVLDFPAPLFISSAGMSNEAVRIFYCYCQGEPTDENLEPSETIKTYLMDWLELDTLLRDCESKGIGIGGKAGGIMMQMWQQGYVGFRNPNVPALSLKIDGNRATLTTDKGEPLFSLQTPAYFEVDLHNPAVVKQIRTTQTIKEVGPGETFTGVTIDKLG